MKTRKICPLATRIKKMMQTDDDVGKISQATPILIGRAMELFLEKLCKQAISVAQGRQAKTLSPSHLKAAVTSDTTLDFLAELVAPAPDLPAVEPDADAQPKPVKRRRTNDNGDGPMSPSGGGRGRGSAAAAAAAATATCTTGEGGSDEGPPNPPARGRGSKSAGPRGPRGQGKAKGKDSDNGDAGGGAPSTGRRGAKKKEAAAAAAVAAEEATALVTDESLAGPSYAAAAEPSTAAAHPVMAVPATVPVMVVPAAVPLMAVPAAVPVLTVPAAAPAASVPEPGPGPSSKAATAAVKQEAGTAVAAVQGGAGGAGGGGGGASIVASLRAQQPFFGLGRKGKNLGTKSGSAAGASTQRQPVSSMPRQPSQPQGLGGPGPADGPAVRRASASQAVPLKLEPLDLSGPARPLSDLVGSAYCDASIAGSGFANGEGPLPWGSTQQLSPFNLHHSTSPSLCADGAVVATTGVTEEAKQRPGSMAAPPPAGPSEAGMVGADPTAAGLHVGAALAAGGSVGLVPLGASFAMFQLPPAQQGGMDDDYDC